MSFQNLPFATFPLIDYPTPSFIGQSTTYAGDKLAFVFLVPHTGNIANVYLHGVSIYDDTLVSLQDVDLDTGSPDGNIDESGHPSGDDDWKIITLDSVRSVSRGEYLSVVLESDGAINTVSWNIASSNVSDCAYVLYYTNGGVWDKQDDPSRGPILVIEYEDGTIEPIIGVSPVSSSYLDFEQSSNPDEISLRFRIPFAARLAGFGFYTGPQSYTVDGILYEGNTNLISLTISQAVHLTLDSFVRYAMFNTAFDLKPDTTYRLALKPDASASVRLYYNTFVTSSITDPLRALPGGKEFYWSERVDSGNWSDSVNKRPAIFLLLEGFDDRRSIWMFDLNDGTIVPFEG